MKQSKIQVHKTSKSYRINDIRRIKVWLERVASLEKRVINSISYAFVSDEELLEMNQKVLKHNYYTDIITFSLSDSAEIEGDVYISYDRIIENATVFHVKRLDEIKRIMVHGLLHLCGYNDKTKPEKERMTQKEDTYLKLYNKMFHVEH